MTRLCMRYMKVRETGGVDSTISLWWGRDMQLRRRDQSALLVLAPHISPGVALRENFSYLV